MIDGWVKLDRKLKNWRYAHKPEYFSFLIHCVMEANIQERYYENQLIPIGAFITNVKELCKMVGITPRTCRTILKNLCQCNTIDVKTTNKFTIITIIDFDSYQQQKNKTDKQPTNNRQTTDKQLTNNRQTTDKQPTNIIRKEENNKEKEKKEKEIIDSCLCLSALSSGTTPPTNSVGDIFSDFENSEITENKPPNSDLIAKYIGDIDTKITENKPPNSDTTEEVEIEKEKSSAKRENENFNDTATNTTAVVQVIRPAEKMPQTEKNTANTQLLLTCLTEDSTAVVRWEETRKWFNEQVRFTKIPPVRVLSPKRKEQFNRCLRQFGRDMIRQAVQMAAKCKFLNGDNDRGWRADFDFIFNINKLPRIVEGFYDKLSKPDAAAVVVQQIAEAGSAEKFNEGNPLFDPNFFKNYFANKNNK